MSKRLLTGRLVVSRNISNFHQPKRDRSKMTLEELETEEYMKQRERRRQDLINPNRFRSWGEMRDDGDLGIFIFFNVLLICMGVVLIHDLVTPDYDDELDDDYFLLRDQDEKKKD